MFSKPTFICPYCFETHKLSEVQFRCTNKRCRNFDDVEMTRYENGNVNTPKQGKKTFTVTSSGNKVPNSAKCPECGNTTYRRICPSCHNELPESTLSGKDMIISVVGSRSAGKSHFVGVIIKELRDRIAVSFGGSLEGFADSYKRWESGFANNLYVNNQRLDLTKSSLESVDNGAYRPLIFKLKLKKKGFFHDEIQNFTFVFFDTAGEDLNDEDTMSTVNKYICKSAGIIFLLDPMQIPAVCSQLDSAVVEGASGIDVGNSGKRSRNTTKADDIMTRVSNLIRHDQGIGENEKIGIPVAAVFSKFDAIDGIVPADCTVHQPSPHCEEKAFVLSDWHNVNGEISGLLREWQAEAFISQLEVNYNKFSYFAVSALGLNNNPSSDGKIDRPRPHRIEDPLLWILKENGVIKAK